MPPEIPNGKGSQMKCKHCGKDIISFYGDVSPEFVAVNVYFHVETNSKYCNIQKAEPADENV